MGIVLNVVSIATIFLFFCAVSVDPKGKARVYVGNPLFGYSTYRDVADPHFRLFGFGSLLWTGALLSLENYNSGHCSLTPGSWQSWAAVLAAATAIMTGKIFLGPMLEVRKSLRLRGENDFTQPWLFMVYDAVAIYPINTLTALTWKHLCVWVAAAIVWALSWIGMFREASFIPYPIILVWVVACFGRAAGLIINFRIPHALQIPIYIITAFCVANVWGHAEAMLKACGAKSGELPSLGTLFTGLIGLPVAEFIAALVRSIL